MSANLALQGAHAARPQRPEDDLPTECLGEVASRLYSERRARDEAIGCTLIHGSAWDLLLYLYACSAQGHRVCITSACAATCLPPTTALRVIARLEHEGMLSRAEIAQDRRVRHLELTLRAKTVMTNYLKAVATARADRPMAKHG